MAEQEARVADMAQALRDGQLQAESAKAALMRALREGQSSPLYCTAQHSCLQQSSCTDSSPTKQVHMHVVQQGSLY